MRTGLLFLITLFAFGLGCAKKKTSSSAVTCTGTTHTLSIATAGDYYHPTGTDLNWSPGDTILIPAGSYHLIDIGNFKGSADCPITIQNSGGTVTLHQMRISNQAQYFKVLGNGDANTTYGIKITGDTNTSFSAYASDFEAAYIETANADVGFYIKKNPVAGDTSTQYPNFTFKNISIHHNYVHDAHGEGMYIGHTYPDADPNNSNLTPIQMANVEIAYNTVDRTDWDGIQLSDATSNASIHHNTVTNYGLINLGSQQAGIILGGNTTGSVYSNTVKQGTGNGIQVFGYGSISVLDNTVKNAGQDGTDSGQTSIYCNDVRVTLNSPPKQQMTVSGNSIINPQPHSAIRVAMYNNYSLAATISNNQITLANAPSNWETTYLLCGSAGCTKSGNTVK